MKAEIIDKSKMIQSASVTFTDLAMNVFISVKDNVKLNSTIFGKDEISWIFIREFDSTFNDSCGLTLKAETEQDSEILKRKDFACHNPEKFWFMFPEKEVWEND